MGKVFDYFEKGFSLLDKLLGTATSPANGGPDYKDIAETLGGMGNELLDDATKESDSKISDKEQENKDTQKDKKSDFLPKGTFMNGVNNRLERQRRDKEVNNRLYGGGNKRKGTNGGSGEGNGDDGDDGDSGDDESGGGDDDND